MSKKCKDITGERFGRLTAIWIDHMNNYGTAMWLCKCQCGKEVKIHLGSLMSGRTKSCGCLRKESCAMTGKRNRKAERNQGIIKLRDEGWKLREIGEMFGIKKQRVKQILDYERDFDYGQKKVIGKFRQPSAL